MRFRAVLLLAVFSHVTMAETEFNRDAAGLRVSLISRITDNYNPTVSPESNGLLWGANATGSFMLSGEGIDTQFSYSAQRFQAKEQGEPLTGDQTYDQYRLELATRLYLQRNVHWTLALNNDVEDQELGTGLSSIRSHAVLSPDTRKSQQINSQLMVGNERGKVEGHVSISKVRYDSANDYVAFFERDERVVKLSAQLQFHEDLYAESILSWREDDFVNPLRSDMRSYEWLLGSRWQLSGKSGLRGLAGQYRVSLDDGYQQTGLSWLAEYDYHLSENWYVAARSSKNTVVGENEESDVSVRTSYNIRTAYNLSERWQIEISWQQEKTDYTLGEQHELLHGKKGLAVLNYEFDTNNQISLSVEHFQTERRATLPVFDQSTLEIKWRHEF